MIRKSATDRQVLEFLINRRLEVDNTTRRWREGRESDAKPKSSTNMFGEAVVNTFGFPKHYTRRT